MKLAQQVIKLTEEMSYEQKIKIIKKKGSILDLKKPIMWKGDKHRQIMTNGIEKSGGSYKLLGTALDTPWTESLEQLCDLIDWNSYEKRKNM